MTDLRNLPKPRRDLVRAVKAEHRRCAGELKVRFDRHPDPRFADLNLQSAIVAQNVLRTCLEAVLQEIGGYPPDLLADLALRLASYAVSAAPIEDHDLLIAHVVRNLPAAHMQRVSQGVVIAADWRMADGDDRPNIPRGFR